MSLILPTLAIELLELVASFLSPTDLCSLRLVCRDLSRKVLNSFGDANFATLQTDLSQRSLQWVSLSYAHTFPLMPK